jgi:hypothetical protein
MRTDAPILDCFGAGSACAPHGAIVKPPVRLAMTVIASEAKQSKKSYLK